MQRKEAQGGSPAPAAGSADAPAKKGPEIPAVVHFILRGDKKAAENAQTIRNFGERARETRPNVKIMVWTERADEGMAATVKDQLKLDNVEIKHVDEALPDPKVAEQASSGGKSPDYGAASDTLRHTVLSKFGGAYFDPDVETKAPRWTTPAMAARASRAERAALPQRGSGLSGAVTMRKGARSSP